MPTPESLQAHYQDPNYFSGEAEQGYSNYLNMRRVLVPYFRRRLRDINTHLPSRGRLLDFGCAAGYFLEVAQADGWEIAGVELSPTMVETAERALGISIQSSLEPFPEQAFDAITLWEVIEHVPEPLAELRRLYRHLRPGGLLMLSTPNTGHWQAKSEPEAWIGFRPPSHLIFFTPNTLKDALIRAGFHRVTIQKVTPVPPLPGWLRRFSTPLQERINTGEAKLWLPALFLWRALRALGWGFQLIANSNDDIFMTLEATAFRPN